MGKKMKGVRKLQCGGEINDPKIINETLRLINELLMRIKRLKTHY